MSRYKKCQTPSCNYVATKVLIAVYGHNDEKLGGWRRTVKVTSNFDETETIKKKQKWKVCRVCYDTLTVDDFEMEGGGEPIKELIRK
jgi:hypothetical protein